MRKGAYKNAKKYEIDGDLYTAKQLSCMSGLSETKIKSRFQEVRLGRAHHTPRQCAGLDKIRGEYKKKNDGATRNLSPGAQARIHGLEYKIGFNGLVFMLINNDWIRSSKTAAEVSIYL